MFIVDLSPNYVLMVPVVTAVLSVVARNPIHAILWLIATFLVTCSAVLYTSALGFTCSLIIIVYIGAIAVLFLFIVMMVPIQARSGQPTGLLGYITQVVVLYAAYVGSCYLLLDHLVATSGTQLAEL